MADFDTPVLFLHASFFLKRQRKGEEFDHVVHSNLALRLELASYTIYNARQNIDIPWHKPDVLYASFITRLFVLQSSLLNLVWRAGKMGDGVLDSIFSTYFPAIHKVDSSNLSLILILPSYLSYL
jgi:hypothetical protein